MFDLGWSKVLILAVVAIVVVGPKELPALLRAVGQFIAQLRRHAAEFRTQFDEAMKSTEFDQIRKDVEAIKSDAQASLRGIEQTIEKDMAEAKSSVDAVMDKAEADIAAVRANGAHPPTGASDATPAVPAVDASPVPAAVTLEPAPLHSASSPAPAVAANHQPPPFATPAFATPAMPEPVHIPAAPAAGPPVATDPVHATVKTGNAA